MIDLSKITEADIDAAAKIDDVDEALAGLMAKAGITTGDVAGVVFSDDFPWAEVAYGSRVGKLREWIKTEQLYAEPDEIADEDFDPENIYNLPSIRQSIEEDRK